MSLQKEQCSYSRVANFSLNEDHELFRVLQAIQSAAAQFCHCGAKAVIKQTGKAVLQ
jgi:hypothetical protein